MQKVTDYLFIRAMICERYTRVFDLQLLIARRYFIDIFVHYEILVLLIVDTAVHRKILT
jgi:hypothetical protein